VTAAPPEIPNSDAEPRQERILALGSALLERARAQAGGLLSGRFYSDALMQWALKDPAFKVRLFRFVDAYPSLRTPEEVLDHLQDELQQGGGTIPPVFSAALAAGRLAKGPAAATIAAQITAMAQTFIAGADLKEALPRLRRLWDQGQACCLDLLGEACLGAEEADAFAAHYRSVIDELPARLAAWPANSRLEHDHLGPIPRAQVAIKVSALCPRFDPIAPEAALGDAMARLLPVLESARDRGVSVLFDMEQRSVQPLTLELFRRCVSRIEGCFGVALQAYLRSAETDARALAQWAQRERKLITVRLVKGAYWDAETVAAEWNGWPSPVWGRKGHTDGAYERIAALLLAATPRAGQEPIGVKLALGTHNLRSISAALVMAEELGLPPEALEVQMLHGMADALKPALVERGVRLRDYVPVGELIPGMAYFVRRLLENTSNESWLRAGSFGEKSAAELLQAPPAPPEAAAELDRAAQARHHQLSPAVAGLGDELPFLNVPLRDFSDPQQREDFAAAVAGVEWPRHANDATPEQAAQLVGLAAAAQDAWGEAEPRLRARVLLTAAERMEAERDALAALLIVEAGKTWREADGEVAEAIDFCRFYARCAVPLFERRRLGRFSGEVDELWHEPRGVAVVIAPWNFPLAILCCMATAALVTGNTVVMKPAAQTLAIAHRLHQILRQALAAHGASVEALQLCTGPGGSTGAALVADPRVAVIAFTGSQEVGLALVERAGFTPASQPHLKQVVCEMGGKNAVIIDTSADLDEAVAAVRASAFGYQGQKCSACSRLIVVDRQGPQGPAISAVVRRLVQATRALRLGDPRDPATDLGPMIDAAARDRLQARLQAALAEPGTPLRLALAMAVPPGLEESTGRAYLGPHIVCGVPPEHPLAQEELFGPVLVVLHAASFEAALAIANGSPYRLTAGVFSRRPAHLELARRRLRVGNLYLNRGITGAVVGRHPFGGFGRSGGGSKAGGADYLLHFVWPRSCAENILRRGFTPELES
jgi:RHH-type proline utilization regulon transcriptional repressor/proline dehydrogenase/delta 1-pyrroline-5-carboxylate dehydrogenase